MVFLHMFMCRSALKEIPVGVSVSFTHKHVHKFSDLHTGRGLQSAQARNVALNTYIIQLFITTLII